MLWKIRLLFYRFSREGRLLATTAGAVAVLGTDVGRTDAYMLILALGALLFASVVCSRAYDLDGVRAEARLPRRVAVGEELIITVHLSNEGRETHEGVRVEGPRLPYDGAWTTASATVATLGPGERAQVELRARFQRRGERRMGGAQAAALVPLGLAQGKPALTEGMRLIVVPRPARVVRVTTPTNRRHQPGGVARASRVGDATELLGVRPYRPGDPMRDLHARSWARLGFPVVREHQQEYFTRVGVVLDTEKRGDGSQLEAALSLAAGVIGRLCAGETLVDLLIAGEQVHQLTLGRSLGTVDQALDVLAGLSPGPRFSAAGVLTKLGPHLERLSSVVVIALAWDDERERLVRSLRGRGVGCAAMVVGGTSGGDGVRAVPVDSITRGEALAL